MTDAAKSISGLSDAKRALLELRRKQAPARSIAETRAQRAGCDEAPLSFAQQRLWLIHQLDPGSYLYNVPRAVHLRGKLDIARLEQCLNEIARRHEVLRTRFPSDGGEPVQKIERALSIPLETVDLSQDGAASVAEATRLALEEYRRPFDLLKGPLLRARLWRLSSEETGEEHVLLIVMHHIISDGWTGGIFFDELGAIYQGFAAGATAPLEELPAQYADYALWQRAQIETKAAAQDLAYWREHLKDAPESIDLPLDHERPPTAAFIGSTESALLSPALSDDWKRFCQEHEVTLFSGLLAALNILLARWTGSNDIVVGTVSANRNRTEIEKLLGCFINFLPLRTQLASGDTAEDILLAANRTALQGFVHQDYPFEKIVEALNPKRTANVNPLFNVALLMQNFPEMAFRAGKLEARFLPLDTEVAFLDLRFIVSETQWGIQIDCEYNTSLFEFATIKLLVDSYVSVIEQLVRHPRTTLESFPIAEPLRREAQPARHGKETFAIAATFTAEPLALPLEFWFKQLQLPARVAFAPYNQVFQHLLDERSLLAGNTNGVNLLLIRLEDWIPFDAVRGDIANTLRTIDEFARALRASAQLSATPHYVCLCPPSKQPPNSDTRGYVERAEQEFISAISGIPHVTCITYSQVAELYPVPDYEDEYASTIGQIPYSSQWFTAAATTIARRIHATRRAPYKVIALDCDQTLWKGVCGEDGPAGITVDSAYSALQEFLLSQRDSGMLLCLVSKNAEEDVRAVFENNTGMRLRLDDIVASRINWNSKAENLKRLASDLQLGLDSFIFIDDNPIECAEARAACPETLVLELPANSQQIPAFLRRVWAFDHVAVTQEDTKRSELYRQNFEREQMRRQSVSLDEFLAGLELHITIRPMEATDLARVAQLVERTNQFNLTTIRRSETEIAQLLATGTECLVVDLRDRFGDYGLVGAMLFAGGEDEVRVDTFLLSCRALGRRVEHHMLAALASFAGQCNLTRVRIPFRQTAKNQPAFDFLESFTALEKVAADGAVHYFFDSQYLKAAPRAVPAVSPSATRKETSAPPRASSAQPEAIARIAQQLASVAQIERAIDAAHTRASVAKNAGTAPRTPTEELIAGVWAQLLRLANPGIHDDFFASGGHSLLAAQVVARIRNVFGIELPLRAVFESPTIAQLADRVDAARRDASGLTLAPPRPRDNSQFLPLSFAQQRLWFLQQLEPENPFYNIPQMLRLRGQLHVDALERSINEIVNRHEALRTTFTTVENEPRQVIAPSLELPLARIDFSSIPADDREREVERLTREEALAPFDLETGPLLRVTLVTLAPDEFVLLVTTHHIVSDRWSMGVFAEELAAIYRAFAYGEPSPLPPLPVQYADYAVWQRNWLKDEALEAQAAHWKRQLGGAPPLLELPTDHPRPAIETHHGAMASRLLPQELVLKLAALGRTEGATLFMTLLAIFALLLKRYSRQDDIVVGSPIAGRNYAELEPLIGFFVNTLALRTDLTGNPTFRELLGRVKEVALGAYAHQDIPFEKLVEELQPERSLSYNPIFQVLFALQNAPLQRIALPGIELERVPVYAGTSVFDMSWFAVEAADGLLLRVEYNTDLFDPGTTERMLGHFHQLLNEAAANPDRHLSELGLMDAKERIQLLTDFQGVEADYPANVCIHDFLSAQAQRTPDAVALIAGTEQVNYAELNHRANQIAHYLIARGAGPGMLVGIFMERTIEMVAAIFGILKSGAAYVPLDSRYPRERLASILEISQSQLIVTQESLRGALRGFVGETISLDRDRGQIAGYSWDDPVTAVTPNHLAYVLFTSGSTGKPKGVAIEHHSPATFIHWAAEYFGAAKLAGVLFGTSICFDMSTFELFVTVAAGGTIVLAENALELASLAARDKVTLINTVPSAMAELVRMQALPRNLKTVALAGEPLPDSLVEEIYRIGTIEEVHNLYGPTESGYSTYTLVRRGARVTIGRPISGVQAYVLDDHGNLASIGVPGELYLAGAGLAREYYGQPELTRERFVANPFASDRNGRTYRTGDVCRWLADGNLEYLGRIDNQVKLRGFRIELNEIEAALERHPSVRQSVVIVREDEPGRKQLIGYVVSHDGQEVVPEEVCASLKTRLPEYMIPAAIVTLDAFPLTPNGKVDRKALPAPEYQRDERETYIAPRTVTEEAVARIWAEVLHLESVSVTDHFFSLGGHSLLATQVISRIRETLGATLPLRAMFEAPVLADLALRVAAAAQEDSAKTLPRLHCMPRTGPMPLSFAQQRLWFLDQLEPGNALYNIPCTLRAPFALDVAAVERSLNTLIERHETLRTTFQAQDGKPVQVIALSLAIDVPVIDLSDWPQAAREREAERRISEEAQHPFNLARGPLLRASVVRLAPDNHLLLLNIHHIVSDRWSMHVLLGELASLYESFITNVPARLADLPVQYADFAFWQREYLETGAMDEQLAYWKSELEGAPPVLELPTDRPRLAIETFRGDVASLSFGSDLTARLHGLTQSHGATLFMTLLAGFQCLLSRYTGQDDIVVGAPIASRNHPDIEPLIGFFANTLPLRARLAGNPSFAGILKQVEATALDAYAHQDLPFEKLVEELAPERSLGHNPLVQVFFILQNAPQEGRGLSNAKFEHIETETKTAKGDLFVSLAEISGELRARVEFNTDLFDRATIDRMLAHYTTLLEAAAVNPALRLSQLPLLTAPEGEQMLGDWNRTDAEYPRQLCVHELFERQVEHAPEAVACVFEGHRLTYRELNDRADQLARCLAARGLGPRKRVGIFVERSVRMMVGLLGILKSGAAYVPVDPAYPSERIRHIFEGAALSLLVTESALVERLPGLDNGIEPICLDAWDEIAQSTGDTLLRKAAPCDAAYVIFTSGSTGRPKGVEVPHRAVVNLLTAMANVLSMGPGDVFPALASFAFDMCIPELYLALVTGGTVAIGRERLAADGEELAAFLGENGATVVHATPTTWNLLLRAGFTGKGLKRAIGAEALPRELCQRLLEADPSLYNFYGPTETTVWSAVHHFSSADEPVVVGKPLANQTVYILDAYWQPVPIGVTGELYIGGDGVANGYLNQPELTAERFVPDPFRHVPGARMYRTGDLAKFLPDGRVEYLRRADYQVKIRGYRIELGEIETVLSQHPSVKESIAVVREDTAGDARLVAYVVTGDALPDEAELRAWVKDRLPEYMVPPAIVPLDRFPLTPNGKVDRKALPAPDYNRPDLESTFERPRTVSEEVISGIWAAVLKFDRVGVTDDFFDLGGHSLLATQVISRVREALDVEVPLRALFEAPTVRGLAARIEMLGREHAPRCLPLARSERNGSVPLSFAQQRLWFLDQLEPGNPLYNVPYLVRLRGVLRIEALEASLNEIVRRHETLRTRFVMAGDEPAQVIDTFEPVTWTVIGLENYAADEREAEMRQRVLNEIQRPFDLSAGRLLRASLVKVAADDHVLVLNTHHIISDRWSLGVLSEELAVLYEAYLTGVPARLPDLPVQYADYAMWQRQSLDSGALEAQLAYWREHLCSPAQNGPQSPFALMAGGPAVLETPVDRKRGGSGEAFWGGIHTLKLKPELVADLRALSRAHSVTFFMTLVASFNVLLARWTHQDDLVIGTDLANRTQVETEKLIGFFVNLLPVRTRLHGDPAFAELLKQVREASLGAFAHQDVPFDRIVEDLKPERVLGRNPLVDVLFVMQNTPHSPREFGGLVPGPVGVTSRSRFDLVLFINDPEGAPFTTWMYNPNLFEAATIARLAEQYEVLLQAVVVDPALTVSSMHALLDEAEQRERAEEQRKFQAASALKLRTVKRRTAVVMSGETGGEAKYE